MRIDMYLINNMNTITQVITLKELTTFFSNVWENILEEELPSRESDNEMPQANLKEPATKKLMSMKKHWFSDMLCTHIPPGKLSSNLSKALISAMTALITLPLNMTDILKLTGGRILMRMVENEFSIIYKAITPCFTGINPGVSGSMSISASDV